MDPKSLLTASRPPLAAPATSPQTQMQPPPQQAPVSQDVEQGQEQSQQPQSPFGPNSELLPEPLQKALWELLIELERNDDLTRRREIRNIVERRLFFRGDQYWWWSERYSQFYPPNVQPTGSGADDEQEMPAFQHVTNIFQPFALSIMSVLSQNRVPTKFFPQSVRDEKDVSTAKSADRVKELIHRNNDVEKLSDDTTYAICVDGFLGVFVRYVTDGEKFGYDKQPRIEQVPQTLDLGMVECPSCGWAGEGTQDMQPICPQCGQPTVPVPPQTVPVPTQTGIEEIPRGQEVVTVVPALHLKRSMTAQSQEDFLYLTWVDDYHKAKAMSQFSHIRDRIMNSEGYDSGLVGEASEQWARRMLYCGSDYTSVYGRGSVSIANKDMGTRRRTWLRYCAFEMVQDTETRTRLQTLYPHGAYVQFYNDLYCESRDEGMDSKWETLQTMPGEGQVRETVMSACIPIQEQVNDSSNMIFEQGMYGTPEKIIDQNLIDPESRKHRVALPGQETFVNLPANQAISAKVMYSAAVEPSITLDSYRRELFGPIAQFVTGVFPALFGGDLGGNDTKGGIQIQRNQAIGRIARVWRRLQSFWANVDLKSVQCFAANRSEDVEIAILGDGGEWESNWISLSDLQGSLKAFPETDQQFPTLQSEVRALTLQLMSMNPEMSAILFGPDNAENTFQEIGLPNVRIPGEAQRKKTYRDIEQLVNSAPQINGTVIIPSIIPDEVVDILPVALETAKQWMLSDAGQAAKVQQPAGYVNVRAYAQACGQMIKMEQLRQAMTQQNVQSQGKGSAGSQDSPSASGSGMNSNGADGESSTGTESPGGPASDAAAS